MRPVVRGPWPARTTSRGTIQAVIYDKYSFTRGELISRIGEYCSYCETPLGANLAVEHMLSKSMSVNESDWNNLLLGCTNCNSIKNAVTQSEGDIGKYFWPCIDPTTNETYSQGTSLIGNVNTFSMLQYTKYAVDLGSLVKENLVTEVSGLDLTTSYDKVWIQPVAGLDSVTTAKIKATICLTGLNKYIPASDKTDTTDRRVENRTLAWKTATSAAQKIAAAYSGYNVSYAMPGANQDSIIADAQNDVGISLLKNQIQSLARATGFWSVWVTVFQDPKVTFINGSVKNALIYELFGPLQFAGTLPNVLKEK